MMDPEDEAFNDIERMSNIRKESVKMTMLKPKTAEEFYNELRNRVLDEVAQEVLKMKADAMLKKREVSMIEEDDDIQDYKKPWVGLTNDELTDLFYNTNLGQASAVAQAIALLKEKNT